MRSARSLRRRGAASPSSKSASRWGRGHRRPLRRSRSAASCCRVVAVAFRRRTERRRHAIDYLGRSLLGGALSAVVLFTSLVAAAAISIVAFVTYETGLFDASV
jgi:hypothetical protein